MVSSLRRKHVEHNISSRSRSPIRISWKQRTSPTPTSSRMSPRPTASSAKRPVQSHSIQSSTDVWSRKLSDRWRPGYSVPYFVFGRRIAINGGRSEDEIAAAIREAADVNLSAQQSLRNFRSIVRHPHASSNQHRLLGGDTRRRALRYCRGDGGHRWVCKIAGGVDAGHAGFATLIDLERDAEGRIDRGEAQ